MPRATLDHHRLSHLLLSFCLVLFLTAPTMAQPRKFTDLPTDLRKQVLLGTPRTSAMVPDSPFATHTTVLAEGIPDSQIPKLVEAISQAGYKWVVDYVSVGPFTDQTPQQIQQRWSTLAPRYRLYLDGLKAAKINVLIRLDPCPWKQLQGEGEPTQLTLERSEAFVRHAVRQLKPYTQHWQIWNEPNLGNAKPHVPPKPYVKLVAHLAKVIRSEQPQAVIYAPATAMLQCMLPKPYPWIDEVLEAGLLQHIDVFTYHPYRQGYERINIPEHASEFAPWTDFQSYTHQLSVLRETLKRHSGGKDVPLAATEDGAPDFVNARGEQEITWVIGAKYELRRSLLDFYNGVYPRTQFCMYRPMPNPFFESEASFNLITPGFEKKPAYFAAQNLHSVLDSTYKRDDQISVIITPTPGQPAIEGQGLMVQTYTKSHADFDEVLIFYWAAEPSDNVHRRRRATLELHEAGYESPLMIDLMAMPATRAKNELIEVINPEFVARVDVKALEPQTIPGGDGVRVTDIEIRDYPMLIKWLRPRS